MQVLACQADISIVFAIAKTAEDIYYICMELRVVLEPSEEGGFTAYVPTLPGCISEGKTKEEALKNIREAIELYLEPVEDDSVRSPNAIVEKIAV